MGDKMISVIKMDDTFIQLLKDKKEITISNLTFCYETLEISGSCLTIYNCNPVDKNMAMYVLFQPDSNKSAVVLSEGGWQLLQPHISYGIVDTDMSVKHNTIFYKSE